MIGTGISKKFISDVIDLVETKKNKMILLIFPTHQIKDGIRIVLELKKEQMLKN